MRMKKMVLAILLAAGVAAGCGTEPAASGSDANAASDAKTITDGETASDAETSAGTESAPDSTAADQTEERTEVRREKYDDCDGSGHGYVEIYYSDGSMETEEY